MTVEVGVLILTAFSVGLVHTILGPDHYIPFVAMARSNRWSAQKTVLVTTLCGVGHVAGSVLLGIVGMLLGTLLFQIQWIESFRGDVAAWLLIGFGVAYSFWGITAAIRDVPHTHLHSHADGTVHSHRHRHDTEHLHLHDEDQLKEAGEAGTDSKSTGRDKNGLSLTSRQLTPWVLFLIFAFGPCEVLIPLLMYPAAEANLLAIVGVVVAFSIATVGTMVASVLLLVYGMSFFNLQNFHRYSHAMAGLAVLLCGTLIKCGL